MPTKEDVLLCWSGGKDSSLALHAIQQAKTHSVTALLTTLTRDYDRISMHGVRRVLLERQAESLGLPLEKIYISKGASNKEYESQMEAALRSYRQRGVDSVAFGDIFLEDLRAYREANLSKLGMRGLFPIWKRDSADLVRDFIRLGFKAVIVCVDTRVLDASFSGASIDEDFLRRLPSHVDPCGENGEFHSFVYDGPNFAYPVEFALGESAIRDSHFCFRDLLPDRDASSRKPV